jgi:hypothetical protein
MDNRRNYYRILHVQPDAPEEIIRSSYRTLMQRLRAHPDLGGDHWNASLINEAYRVLTDASQRAAYDAQYRERYRKSAPAAPAAEDTIYTASARIGCFFCGTPPANGKALTAEDTCQGCRSPLYPADRRKLGGDRQRAMNRLGRRHSLVLFTRWPQAQGATGESRDISLNGIRFVTREALAIGTLVKIESPVCSAVGRVANMRPNAEGNGLCLVGAEFVSVIFARSRGGFMSASA